MPGIICAEQDLMRVEETRACIACPEALDVSALYNAILAATENIMNSSLYAANNKNGLINFVQGRHVLIDPVLCVAADCVIWLDQ